jgi:hypothetical protein
MASLSIGVLAYWGDGDMDRDRIKAARAFLASS